MTSDEYWEKFIHSFDVALDDCIENGHAKRLTIGVNDRHITIDIYESKVSMKILDETVLKIAKQERAMERVK